MRPRKNTIILSCVITALIVGQTVLALANSSYYLIDESTWYDADKTSTNTDDDLMCWAAATSNILAATDWGDVKSFTSADDIFSYFQSYWTDAGGNPYNGVYWWFYGKSLTQSPEFQSAGWSQLEMKGGGGFYTASIYSDYIRFSTDDNDAMSTIASYINDNYAVTLSLAGASGHAVTLWGYEVDDYGSYAGIYITDSDDNKDGLQYYKISYSSEKECWYFYISGYLYYITEVFGLVVDTSSTSATPVPEPVAAVLFGCGLLGIAAVRGRRYGGTISDKIS